MLYAGLACGRVLIHAGILPPEPDRYEMEDSVVEATFPNPERKCVVCGEDVTNKATLRCQPCYFQQAREGHSKNRSIRANDILVKRKAGESIIAIAKQMGVSRIRVYQILEAYKRDNPDAFVAAAKSTDAAV